MKTYERKCVRAAMSPTSPSPSINFPSDYGLWGIAVAIPLAMPCDQPCRRTEIVSVLGEIGAWGVNLHDNDLGPN